MLLGESEGLLARNDTDILTGRVYYPQFRMVYLVVDFDVMLDIRSWLGS